MFSDPHALIETLPAPTHPFMSSLLGQPQFTPAEDANTSAYSPAAPIQICLIAGLLGYATSLPALGLVQRIYVLAAVLLATVVTQELFHFFHTSSRFAKQWMFFWFPFL